MKKITSILIIFSIILGGLRAAAFSTVETESTDLIKKSITIVNNKNYKI